MNLQSNRTAGHDPAMLVQVLTPEDAAAFVALRLRGLQECPSAFASSYDDEVNTPLTEAAARLRAAPDRAVIGARDGASLVAVAGLQREKMGKLAHKAFLWGMYVAPEARGRGVGFKVVSAALEHAALRLGVDQVNLGVNTSNSAAIALYKKVGFVPYGLEHDFLRVNGSSYDEYLMVCKVRGAQKNEA